MWIFLLARLAHAGPDDLEALLASELDRATEALADRPEPPHYVSLSVEDWQQVSLGIRDGTVANRQQDRSRYLDVDLRTGTPALDSTHPLRGFSALAADDRRPVQIPLDDGYALKHALWRELDERYREAAERIVVLRANQVVKVEEEDPAPDFEPRTAVQAHVPTPDLDVDLDAWAPVLLEVGARLDAHPDVHRAFVSLDGDRYEETFVDTEGARLVHGRRHLRISLSAYTTAADGDEISVFRALDVHDPARLPDQATLDGWADQALADLLELSRASRGDPYSGPVMLEGRAAAVFFHEVLGHRVEGHRQKREDEGKTFAEQVGKPVLPAWIDVYDDPTLTELAGEQLNGFYQWDDEGVPASRASIVDDGRFVGFLMSRSPIPGFEHSNGHGRRSSGNWAQARMGNTVVEAAKTVPRAELRRRLIEQVKAQGLPYGYVVDEIEGGFTMTGRVTPNAFNVRASSVWRVWADGRPDQRIRGIDLVGTPLVAFGNLIAAGDDPQVFNGTCGAESGWVPVSAVAPSLLFSKLEFQLKEKGQDRPPLLPKPHGPPPDGSADAEVR